ncbi:MAG: ferrous iron transport protein A [Saprospiraceae bacterium]|nr:ferrous iron transport protein A [Saprospiraceae bacterium]
MENKPTALSLNKGQSATIDFIESNEFSSRLLSLGIVPGKKCKIVGLAPFGGAKIMALENHLIALRDEELSSVYITLENRSAL